MGKRRDTLLPASGDELFALDDMEFIVAACELVLGPEPPQSLMARCERLMRCGWSRSYILASIFDAGTLVTLPGRRFVADIVRRYRTASGTGWAAWYYRHVFQVETDTPDEINFRRMAREEVRDRWRLSGAHAIAPSHEESVSPEMHISSNDLEAGSPSFGAPLLSVILEGGRPSVQRMLDVVNSMRSQSYPHWQLILCAGAADAPVMELISTLVQADQRILLIDGAVGDESGDRALASAKGSHLVVMNADAALEPDALAVFATVVSEEFPDLIYSDSTSIAGDEAGTPVLRPAYSLELHRARSYLGEVVCYRTSLLRDVGGLSAAGLAMRHEDLLLRAVERASHVVHVPKSLYRCCPSPGCERSAAPDAAEAKRILLSHLERCEEVATVAVDTDGGFDIRYSPRHPLKVAIIIPTKDQGEMVEKCVLSIERTVDPGSYEIYLVDHESTDPRSLEIFARLGRTHKVLTYRGEFNFSAINNWAVGQVDPESTHYLFCNNDIEAIEPGWLERMASIGAKKDVAIVGAKLLYPDLKTIQHAGVCVGMNGVAGHFGHFLEIGSPHVRVNSINSCFGGLTTSREMSAVTGACMLVRRDAFERCGGFDEQLAVGFGDVDLCLRAGQFGYRIVFCAKAELVHHESVSRGKTPGRDPHPADTRFFVGRWQSHLKAGDPYFNPSFALHSYSWEFASGKPGESTDASRFRSRSVRKLVSSDL